MQTSLFQKPMESRGINSLGMPMEGKKEKAVPSEKKLVDGALDAVVEEAFDVDDLIKSTRVLAPEIAKRLKAEEYRVKKMHVIAQRKIAQRHIRPKPITLSQESLQEAPWGAALQRLKAAEKLGQQVRNVVVLPSQIVPELRTYFPEEAMSLEKVYQLAQVICREVNEMTFYRDKTKGSSWCLDPRANVHAFPFLDDKNLSIKPAHRRKFRQITMGHACWLEMSSDGKKFRMLLVDLSPAAMLGKGTYKKVFKAHNLEMELKAQASTKGIAARKAAIRPEVFIHAIDEDMYTFASIKNGLTMQQMLLHEMQVDEPQDKESKGKEAKVREAKVNLTSLPMPRLETNPDSPGLHRRQEWYNGSLHKAIHEKRLPLGIHDKSPVMAITLKHCLQALLDVSCTLRKMHALGISHRDIKPPNILLKIENASVSGFLADFDMAKKIMLSTKDPYEYWDPTSEAGLVTPFTDYFGLAMCVAEAVLGGYSALKEILENPADFYKNLEKQKKWERAVHVGLFKKAVQEFWRMTRDEASKHPLLSIDEGLSKIESFPQTNAKILEQLQAFFSHPDTLLTDEARHVLPRLKIDLQLASIACQLVIKTIKRGEQVFKYFKDLKRTDIATFDLICQQMPDNDPIAEKALMAKKLKIIENCANAVGGYSLEHIEQEIEAMLKELDS